MRRLSQGMWTIISHDTQFDVIIDIMTLYDNMGSHKGECLLFRKCYLPYLFLHSMK